MINDANLLGEAIINSVPTFCSSVVGIVVTMGIVAFWSPSFIGLIIAFTLVVSLVNSKSARAMNKAVCQQQAMLAQVVSASSSAVRGYLVVEPLKAKETWFTRFSNVVSAHLNAVRRRGRIQGVVGDESQELRLSVFSRRNHNM